MTTAPASPPNVLFIAVDDLNDWIGCLQGHPQTLTPNIDRLAATGTLFTNAHCPAPACNPSRSAIMTGIAPNKSGLYDNRQKMREILPTADLLPKHFSRHGYHSLGSGKILHYFIDAQSWDDYYPAKESENPFPRTLYPKQRPVNLSRGGPWQYVETDWAALDATDEEYGGDWLVSQWVSEQLAREQKNPFFLACGIYRPHEPWFVPRTYFDKFPLDQIQLPPGYRADDLDDLPTAGRRRGPNRYFEHIQAEDQWKQAIQGYLASIAFADAMVGRVITALESGPNADNTIVVLWSDHGWHLGEKQHWQKFTGWRVCTRVPLIIRAPKGCPGLVAGTVAGTTCDQPVNLLSLFPTLTHLTGIPGSSQADAPSLLPLLEDSQTDWPHVSTTYLNRPEEYSISDHDWRYIHYKDNSEELYQISSDPHEWNNLATNPQHLLRLQYFRSRSPKIFHEYVPISINAMPKLQWIPITNSMAPPSKPDGQPFDCYFVNHCSDDLELFWISPTGKPRSYGILTAKTPKRQNTRPGAVWMVADTEGQELGFFTVGDRSAQAIIPTTAIPQPVQKK
ncbi:MAG TPA: iduronate-2-sulfatase [Rhodopirellula sp.]|nr:iduronate-2-sulfatase [Rhodopirellula sp.]